MSPVVLIVGVFLVSAVVCHFIAKQRGRDPVFWGVMGAVIGPLAIPLVFLSKRN